MGPTYVLISIPETGFVVCSTYRQKSGCIYNLIYLYSDLRAA